MTEFKVGDAVEFVKDESSWAREGAQGVITSAVEAWLEPGEQLIGVLMDTTVATVHAYGSSLKHVEATPLPADFRFFRRTDGAISEVPYPTFEAALEGWRGFAQNGDQTEIVELISHGTYKATLKVEVVEPITEGA